MKWTKYIKILMKVRKVFKSSGKGVFGLSKTAIGIMIIILPVFGLEEATRIIQGQEAELSEALRDIIMGIGVLIAAWGAASKQEKIDED